MFENIQTIAVFIFIASLIVIFGGKEIKALSPFTNLAKLAILPAAVIFVALFCVQQVPAGHVKVATLFGKVQDNVYEEGLHFPVNPLYCLLYTSPSPRDQRGSRMPSSA